MFVIRILIVVVKAYGQGSAWSVENGLSIVGRINAFPLKKYIKCKAHTYNSTERSETFSKKLVWYGNVWKESKKFVINTPVQYTHFT